MKLRKINLDKSRNKNKNKKGSIADLLVWVALGFVTILFFAIWIYGFGLISDAFAGMDDIIIREADTGNPSEDYSSIKNISDVTLVKVENVQTTSLHVLAFVMLFVNAISIPMTYFIQKSHPAFFLFYLFMVIISFMASVYISNAYEDLMVNDTIGSTLSDFKAASFVMLNLPIWVSIIGMLGLTFLFTGIIRDAGAGGFAG